jgi:hypothetical protein
MLPVAVKRTLIGRGLSSAKEDFMKTVKLVFV